MKTYTAGLDIGKASVGWAAIDQKNAQLIDFGVRLFNEAKEASEPRLKRSSRRSIRRKHWRKEQLLNAFDDFGLISKEEIEKYGKAEYLHYFSKKDGLCPPKDSTIYHLRQRAISEKVNIREILLCLYNILQARGHFLLETIDFNKDGITFDLFKERYYKFAESKNIDFVTDLKEFEDKVLHQLFYGLNNGLNEFKKEVKNGHFVLDDLSENKLQQLCFCIAGGVVNVKDLFDLDEDLKFKAEQMKEAEDLSDDQIELIELYDLCLISKVLNEGCNYPCDIDVKKADEYSVILNQKEKMSEKEFKEALAKAEYPSVVKNNKIVRTRSIKNVNHSYPNGLYVKEVSAILKNQQKYYKEITDEFVEVCCSITSARIPYYIGPLGKNAKNGWADLKGNFKYSYEYSLKNLDSINQFESIRRWKLNMVSHCTYLPEEIALPKGSFVGEIYSILNELNNLKAIDKDGNDYYLTKEDKINVFDNLFLKQTNVKLDDVKNILNLYSFKPRNSNLKYFNNKITLYHSLINILTEYKLESIKELFSNKEKIKKIEDIILNINLFSEEKSKLDFFMNDSSYNFEFDKAKKLSKLKTNSFYSFSYKFIMEQSLNKNGESMIDILFDDNTSEINNQQNIIYNAQDSNGNHIDFLSNKYEKIIKDNNNELTIDLLINNSKPLMPVSRAVIRSLNETIKVFNAMCKLWGVPERLIIENANGEDGIKDFTEQNGSSMKHFKSTSKLYEYLKKQLNENRNDEILNHSIESWEELETHYEENRNKIELYIRQDGIDLLTGQTIDITRLSNYEIDHILPRGFGDDSMDDKMLTLKEANALKADRLPLQYIESSEFMYRESMNPSKYEKIVNKLFDLKLISNKKYARLMLKDESEVELFINQNLVDTRYVISEFRSMLNAYIKVNNLNCKIVSLNGSFTSSFRNVFGIKKSRDLGSQHHALDAAVLCLTDNVLSQYYPNYDSRGNFDAYRNFINTMNDDSLESKERFKRVVQFAFRKAYNQEIYAGGIGESKLLLQIKNTTPLISWKIEKNYNGKFFNDTVDKPKTEDDKSVPTILGANNSKRSFNTIYPVAVDYYKYKHKHYAIHIPYMLVDDKGNINKNLYSKLVKEHYSASFLLDDDGNPNSKMFRFRAYKNDILYDTELNDPFVFNLGSIAKKLTAIKYLNVYSYNAIYSFANDIRRLIIDKFNIKTVKKDGIDFKELTDECKKKIVLFICNDMSSLTPYDDKKCNNIYDLTKNIKNIYDFSATLAYWIMIANISYAPPTLEKQNTPAANNEDISKNPDAEYVKLKYNILGLRFANNEKGTLIISGPNGYQNGYKRIKKEDFSWKISKY